jgi:glycosyltransferase involved in cell wall biosynthesis
MDTVMSTPAISVVMPVYNGEKYLREAIDSILSQTYTDFEFIILNDGSTDKTEEIILSYTDPRIVYVKNEDNLQIVKTLNKGIGIAKGKYIARMDADDISLPERFEKQFKFMEENPEVGVCGAWIETFGNQSLFWQYPVNHNEIRISLLFYSCMGHPTVMIRNDFRDLLFYDQNYNKAEDYELWQRLVRITKFHNLPFFLLKYRLHLNQTDLSIQSSVANSLRQNLIKSYCPNLDDSYLIDFNGFIDGKLACYKGFVFVCTKVSNSSFAKNLIDIRYINKLKNGIICTNIRMALLRKNYAVLFFPLRTFLCVGRYLKKKILS